jgi:hypothetical protein
MLAARESIKNGLLVVLFARKKYRFGERRLVRLCYCVTLGVGEIREDSFQRGRRKCCSREMEQKLAHPEGLEPPTLWFEARCSIQLS